MTSVAEPCIRPLAAGEELAAAALDAPPRDATAVERWLWRHPPRAGGRRVMVAERDGRLLATASAVDLSLRVAGEVVPAVRLRWSAGAATPEPVLRATIAALVERLRADGDCRVALWARGGGQGSPDVVAGASPVVAAAVRLRRPTTPSTPTRRLLSVRAELAADWEPRLDELAATVAPQYPDGIVRGAGFALGRWAGHPDRHWRRFLLLPRFSERPIGWLVLGVSGGVCRWEDLLWDHAHPRVLEAAARVSARLAGQVGAGSEEAWLAGDDEGRARLTGLGFANEPLAAGLAALTLDGGLDLSGAFYATAADLDDP